MFRRKRSLAWWWQNPVPGSLPHIFHQMRMLPLVLRLRGSLWYLPRRPPARTPRTERRGSAAWSTLTVALVLRAMQALGETTRGLGVSSRAGHPQQAQALGMDLLPAVWVDRC